MKSKVDLFVINKVREKRKELGISQRGLAAILECSPSFIGQVESDKFDIKYSVHQVFLIAQFFDCSPADFLLSILTYKPVFSAKIRLGVRQFKSVV